MSWGVFFKHRSPSDVTHLSINETVEGDSHCPHVQRLENKHSRHLLHHRNPGPAIAPPLYAFLLFQHDSRQLPAAAHLPTEALLVLRYHLRGHEGRRPGRARQLGVHPLEFLADAEVGDLDVAVVAQQQVGGFDVPVDDLVVVH